MRTTAPRPYRRVCTIATATLLTVGMGVFGSSAAFADTLPADASSPAPTAAPSATAAPSVTESPAPTDGSTDATTAPSPTPSATEDPTPTTEGTAAPSPSPSATAPDSSPSAAPAVAAAGTAPKLAAGSATTFDLQVGQPFSYTYTATGDPAPFFNFFRAEPDVPPTLPKGLTFDDGTISGTPTETGSFLFQIEARNDVGTDQVNVTMTVEGPEATISGGTTVGSTLTAATDGWPTGTTFTYRWLRGATAIPGATAATYGIVPADAGSTISVAVTGTGPAAGDTPTTVTSAATAVVGSAPTFTAQPGAHLTVTAGAAYSFTWTADGDPTPRVTDVAAPTTAEDDVPPGGVFTEAPGSLTLAGTTTVAGDYLFAVTAINAVGTSELLPVTVTVEPAAAVGVEIATAEVTAADSAPVWIIDPDGTSTFFDADGEPHPNTPIRSRQGATMAVFAVAVDEFDNVVDTPAPVVTSSVASDTVVTSPEGASLVTFNHASPHRITVVAGGVTNSYVVQVDPVTGAVGTVAVTTPGRSAGTLAYTGSDDSGLLGWALGLIAAGAAVTVLRIRRRRTQR